MPLFGDSLCAFPSWLKENDDGWKWCVIISSSGSWDTAAMASTLSDVKYAKTPLGWSQNFTALFYFFLLQTERQLTQSHILSVFTLQHIFTASWQHGEGRGRPELLEIRRWKEIKTRRNQEREKEEKWPMSRSKIHGEEEEMEKSLIAETAAPTWAPTVFSTTLHLLV